MADGYNTVGWKCTSTGSPGVWEILIKDPGTINVCDYPYYAKGDGATDDTAAIQAAISAAQAAGGGTVLLPAGVYRTTDRLLVGARFCDEAEMIAGAYGIWGGSHPPSWNATQWIAAQASPLISIVGIHGACIWADFSAAKAAIYYGAVSNSTKANPSTGHVTGLTVYSQSAFAAGAPVSGPTPTSQIGVFVPGSISRHVTDCNAHGFSVGFLDVNNYYGHSQQNHARWCTTGHAHYGANAAAMTQLFAYECATGHTITGEQWNAANLNTEECQCDLYVPNASDCAVRGAYFENTHADHTGYGIVLGDAGASGHNQVVRGEFTGVHCGRAGAHGLSCRETAFVHFRRSDISGARYFDTANSTASFEDCSTEGDPTGAGAGSVVEFLFGYYGDLWITRGTVRSPALTPTLSAAPSSGYWYKGAIVANAGAAAGQVGAWQATAEGGAPGWVSAWNLPATAAPTTGAHVAGEYVRNSAPSSGQPIGWVCTASATPGTWVSIGNLP